MQPMRSIGRRYENPGDSKARVVGGKMADRGLRARKKKARSKAVWEMPKGWERSEAPHTDKKYEYRKHPEHGVIRRKARKAVPSRILQEQRERRKPE